jgi:hypothetical protein
LNSGCVIIEVKGGTSIPYDVIIIGIEANVLIPLAY